MDTHAPSTQPTYTAFAGTERIASGTAVDVARQTKLALDAGETRTVLVFDNETSRPLEIDFRGSVDDVVERLQPQALPVAPDVADGGDADAAAASDDTQPSHRSPGRPRLGVVGREVTLLPRHWEWLSAQPGGASVALRKLVEQARKDNAGKDRVRAAQESTYRFAAAMAGNEPDFEEACRALYAGDRNRFQSLTAQWPTDVATHAVFLAEKAFEAEV